ncbi:DNA circularization N-terminal domain-containing protein [Salmonella enterica]|nr:DNA circularization N-terminal domain-containing protein [Salmonella enterica]
MAFFSSTGWRGRLRDASFRGVPFSVEDDESTFGRRVSRLIPVFPPVAPGPLTPDLLRNRKCNAI